MGREVFEAGMIGKLVINQAMEPNSLVVVTFEGNPGSSWWIEEKTTESFMVKLATPAPMDVPFTYWILGVDEPEPPAEEPPAEEPPAEEPVIEEPPAEEPPAEEPPAEEPQP
ncbi:hypothetical protein AMJ57_01950 [Parcubacteria bacterium SG8_24]|nr:MAG: hypothetical protein AMJ57_01950 [Parcubacteria bacterium SG8_24]